MFFEGKVDFVSNYCWKQRVHLIKSQMIVEVTMVNVGSFVPVEPTVKGLWKVTLSLTLNNCWRQCSQRNKCLSKATYILEQRGWGSCIN